MYLDGQQYLIRAVFGISRKAMAVNGYGSTILLVCCPSVEP